MSSQPIADNTWARFGTDHVFYGDNRRAFEWLHQKSEAFSDAHQKALYRTAGSMIGHHNRRPASRSIKGYDRIAKSIVKSYTGQEMQLLTRDQWEAFSKEAMNEFYPNGTTQSNKTPTINLLYQLCTEAFEATASAPTTEPYTDGSAVKYSTQNGGEAFIIETLKRDPYQRRVYEKNTIDVMRWKHYDINVNEISEV